MRRKTDDLQFWEVSEQQKEVSRERSKSSSYITDKPKKDKKKEKGATGYVQEYINIKDI